MQQLAMISGFSTTDTYDGSFWQMLCTPPKDLCIDAHVVCRMSDRQHRRHGTHSISAAIRLLTVYGQKIAVHEESLALHQQQQAGEGCSVTLTGIC